MREKNRITTGTKLTIEGKEYIVIEHIKDDQYKVLANGLASSDTKTFGSTNEYKISRIATYLDNDYYNSLPENTRNAIVETPIQQKISSTGYDNGKNSPTWTGETKDAGIHKVFLPSWDEITKAARSTDKETLQPFVNGKYVWLRDTYSNLVLAMGVNGYLGNDYPYSIYYVRPAFVIDLSKVKYILLEGIEQEENKPFVLIKGTVRLYDISEIIRQVGGVFESSNCEKQVVKTFSTLKKAEKELKKYRTSFHQNEKDGTFSITEYCLEENGEKIAFSNRVFTAFIAYDQENGRKTLTKTFSSDVFGNSAYDLCNEWSEQAYEALEKIGISVEEFDVKYIDRTLTVEEYIKLYNFFYLLDCDGIYFKKSLDRNNREYLEVSVRNCDSFKYFDIPIFNDGEFAGLEFGIHYDQYDLELDVDYRC